MYTRLIWLLTSDDLPEWWDLTPRPYNVGYVGYDITNLQSVISGLFTVGRDPQTMVMGPETWCNFRNLLTVELFDTEMTTKGKEYGIEGHLWGISVSVLRNITPGLVIIATDGREGGSYSVMFGLTSLPKRQSYLGGNRTS